MGTNYYHRTAPCRTCGHNEEIHIGKSSAGWTFSFHGTDMIRSWTDWKAVLAKGGTIWNEYGKQHTIEGLTLLILCKVTEPHNHAKEYPDDCWLDDEGHGFSDSNFS